MSYITTGSSNTVTNGTPVVLDIRISKEPSEGILLNGPFSIENLNSIVANNDLSELSCKLYGKIEETNEKGVSTDLVEICEFKYDDANPGTRSQRVFYAAKLSYLELRIRAEKCTITPPESLSELLKIQFWAQESTRNSIDFKVSNVKIKPEITWFVASESVLQGNRNNVTLSWQIKGEVDSCTLRDGMTILGYKEGSSYTTTPKIGDHLYTLEIKKGDTVVTKSVKVRALGTPQFSLTANPLRPFLISNFCVSSGTDYLFSLILTTTGNQGEIAHIGYTNEGFSGNWDSISLSKSDKDDLKPFSNSPMVHLKSVGEVYGRLLFIGGSYVDPEACNNAVAIVHLDEVGSKVRIVTKIPWDARMGHSCQVFTHGGQDKIWLLGGADEYTNSLNDVWVSTDGEKWENIKQDGTVNNSDNPAPMPWVPRSLAGVAVELDTSGHKKALWFGGGFSESGAGAGAETADIWKFENGAWRKTSPMDNFNTDSYLSLGLGFWGLSTGNDSVGIALFGRDKTKYFKTINRDPNNNTYYPNNNDSDDMPGFDIKSHAYVVTSFFKGCFWYMVYTYRGDAGVNYQDLVYWVPTVTGKTIILS